MPRVGEGFRLSLDTLRHLSGEAGPISAMGGYAVLGTYVESEYAGTLPWLIGLSVDHRGAPAFQSHRLLGEQGESCTPAWCQGVVGSTEGVVTHTIGGLSSESAYNRLLFLQDTLRRDDAHDPRDDAGSMDLLREFYLRRHTFDPARFPVLHQAMEQLVRSPAP
jgi:hypothetical protein